MICSRCGTQNEENSKFCEKCGSPIVAGAQAAYPLDNKEALPQMRPLTKLAYLIYDFENRGAVKAFLYFIFAALCVGILAVVMALKDAWGTLSTALGSSFREVQIESVEKVRGAVSIDSGRTIILLILALILMIVLYAFIGRLLMRLKKVVRKEKQMAKIRREHERVESLISSQQKRPAIEPGDSK